MRALEVGTSLAATLLRGASGLSVGELRERPAEPLVVYDFESCPFCRKAREALTVLDLKALVKPCPKGGTRFRDELKARGGKLQFPYLIDPNHGKEMYESDDIVAYLFQQYGDGRVPFAIGRGPLPVLSGSFASLARANRGTWVRPSRAPEQPLELWSFEASPFSRLVREVLCELELPYLLHNVGRGSPSRDAFVKRSGRMMVPFLVDPNTGTELFESADIVRYLESTYGEDD